MTLITALHQRCAEPHLGRAILLDNYFYPDLYVRYVSVDHSFGDVNDMINCCRNLAWHLFFSPAEFERLVPRVESGESIVGVVVCFDGGRPDDFASYADLQVFAYEVAEDRIQWVERPPADLSGYLVAKLDTVGRARALFMSGLNEALLVRVRSGEARLDVPHPEILVRTVTREATGARPGRIYPTGTIGVAADGLQLLLASHELLEGYHAAMMRLVRARVRDHGLSPHCQAVLDYVQKDGLVLARAPITHPVNLDTIFE